MPRTGQKVKRRKPTPVTISRAEKVRKLYSQGCTNAQTAAALGIASRSFIDWMQMLRNDHPDLQKRIKASRPKHRIPAAMAPARLAGLAEDDGVRELSVTLPESLVVVSMRLPVPMSAADFQHFHSLIGAMKPALTQSPDGRSNRQRS